MPGFPRLRSWLEQLLHTHDTPHRTAGAYALGVFLAFSPMLGLHAVLGLALAFVFRLNRVAVILGVYTNLPWVVPAYYTLATIAGAAILGVDVQPRALEEGIRAISATSWGQVPSPSPKSGAPDLGLRPRVDDRRGGTRGRGVPRLARHDSRPSQTGLSAK